MPPRSPAKKPDAIRNLKRAVKNGDRRGVTTETLAALAPVLKTSAAWLLEGHGDPGAGSQAKVVGRIGAGAEILPEYEQIPEDGPLRNQCAVLDSLRYGRL